MGAIACWDRCPEGLENVPAIGDFLQGYTDAKGISSEVLEDTGSAIKQTVTSSHESIVSSSTSLEIMPNEITRMFIEHLSPGQRIGVARVSRLFAFLVNSFPDNETYKMLATIYYDGDNVFNWTRTYFWNDNNDKWQKVCLFYKDIKKGSRNYHAVAIKEGKKIGAKRFNSAVIVSRLWGEREQPDSFRYLLEEKLGFSLSNIKSFEKFDYAHIYAFIRAR